MVKSVEEKVEDFFKYQLKENGIRYYEKTESMNPDIDDALKKAPSKSGGKGNNYPDIRTMVSFNGRNIPVMIEAKGREGDMIKLTDGLPDMSKRNYVQKYAVNGAIHYALAVVEPNIYTEALAIGINGWNRDDGTLATEVSVWYISQKLHYIPKKLLDGSGLSFLKPELSEALIKNINTLCLSDDEIEKAFHDMEKELDANLRDLNQTMQDVNQVGVNYRVNLITGMIMAALGTDSVRPLRVEELDGAVSDEHNDGTIIMERIRAFIRARKLPEEKQRLILNILSGAFEHSQLYTHVDDQGHECANAEGESTFKRIFRKVDADIMPGLRSDLHLDFTGKLFNVLNAWVTVPDGDKNDVVLTPRYVTELMARLCRVDKDSYVWDYATGSAGFLVSSMKLMLQDAKERIKDPAELAKTEWNIRSHQVLGIEKLPDIYMLAVLNMLLMGDGSSNILRANSLTEFDGTYAQGDRKDKAFPATVFLLNPPYSASGKGFVFVERALSKMNHGWAAVLIQENAGSGNGLPYTAKLLQKNTLVASIHMADIFHGKAGVQTAIYLFNIGVSHNKDALVKFIDMSNDGYTRQNRKKSSLDVNLRDTSDVKGRYQEIVDIILGHQKKN
jgi:hypothetical protein